MNRFFWKRGLAAEVRRLSGEVASLRAELAAGIGDLGKRLEAAGGARAEALRDEAAEKRKDEAAAFGRKLQETYFREVGDGSK